MLVYQEQSAGGLQKEDFGMEVEDENYVTQKPQMQGNEKEKQMEHHEVNIILT